MAVKEIIKMGHPTLRKKAQKVEQNELASKKLFQLIEDMKESMKAAGGIGLAAPQINVSKQVALIEIPETNQRYGEILETFPQIVVINPQIQILDNEKQGSWEGCLSLPGLQGYVERPKKIKLNYLTPEGVEKSQIFDGFPATVVQHELDHLEGILYVDKIKDTRLFGFSDSFIDENL